MTRSPLLPPPRTHLADPAPKEGRSRIVVLVNGDESSAAGARARGLFDRLDGAYATHVLYRWEGKSRALWRFAAALRRLRPDLVYVINPSVSGVGAAMVARLGRRTFVLDTGDLAGELAHSTRRVVWPARKAIELTEAMALRAAAAVVVRSTRHKEFLDGTVRRPVYVIRDGVDCAVSRRIDVTDLKRELGLDGFLCIGVMGSLNWNRRWSMCYGWDLVEALALLEPSLPVRGLVVGNGDGLPRLRERTRELGIEDRVRFAGKVPFADVPRYVNVMDVALSTQTNDRVGQARTTGKLAEYMACGRYVLASDVGEAKFLLPPEMRLAYDGVKDTRYPERLAAKIRELVDSSPEDRRRASDRLVERARTQLDYSALSTTLRQVLDSALDRSRRP
jgi:glycosyltransferase involved in cell wall biosynthesis